MIDSRHDGDHEQRVPVTPPRQRILQYFGNNGEQNDIKYAYYTGKLKQSYTLAAFFSSQ